MPTFTIALFAITLFLYITSGSAGPLYPKSASALGELGTSNRASMTAAVGLSRTSAANTIAQYQSTSEPSSSSTLNSRLQTLEGRLTYIPHAFRSRERGGVKNAHDPNPPIDSPPNVDSQLCITSRANIDWIHSPDDFECGRDFPCRNFRCSNFRHTNFHCTNFHCTNFHLCNSGNSTSVAGVDSIGSRERRGGQEYLCITADVHGHFQFLEHSAHLLQPAHIDILISNGARRRFGWVHEAQQRNYTITMERGACRHVWSCNIDTSELPVLIPYS
ncbi:hypothetical protein K438DRAFT_2030050 [Mycena galopus ATCC 62051]|nr:hypothetical protein K438DRAFT_2030050 [Mycena galopus ATCC 62051]